MKDFLLEIGTEELPVWAQKEAEKGLFSALSGFFKENHIKYESFKVSSTPRRVFVYFKNVQETQDVIEKEIKGPPLKVAYKDGKPQPALLGFMKQRGLTEDDIEKRDGYIYAKVKEGGEDTAKLLTEALPKIIEGLKFKKSMRWSSEKTFARPVRWILALFGDKTLKFEAFGIKSSNITKGHRFLGDSEIVIDSSEVYEIKLAENGVIADKKRRMEILKEKMEKIAKTLGGSPEDDPDLLDEVTGLVEWPGVIYGSFDERFLELPHIVIKAAMKQHQRYFPVIGENKDILPYFISAINNEDRFSDNIRPGMEKVLVSRLEDAEFYFKEDMKVSPKERSEMLRDIVWMENVGSVKDKIEYALKLAEYILDKYNPGVDVESLKDALVLSKFDLTTQMIRDGKEFTKLEGEIAAEYAKRAGINEKVINIIKEHMLPRRFGDRIPESKEAALIGLIFRILDLVALLKIDYNFSSSKDPYGARRNTYAIFDIIVGHGFHFNLDDLFHKGMEIMNVPKSKFKILWNYVKERFFNFLEEREKMRYDIVDAIIEVNSDIYDVRERARILDSKMKMEPELFERIAISLKRVNNILKGIENFAEIREDLMTEHEIALYRAAKELEPVLTKLIANRDYEEFLNRISELSPKIDSFFDNVFVMAEDEKLKNNRLSLLAYIRKLFNLYGDFSKLVV